MARVDLSAYDTDNNGVVSSSDLASAISGAGPGGEIDWANMTCAPENLTIPFPLRVFGSGTLLGVSGKAGITIASSCVYLGVAVDLNGNHTNYPINVSANDFVADIEVRGSGAAAIIVGNGGNNADIRVRSKLGPNDRVSALAIVDQASRPRLRATGVYRGGFGLQLRYSPGSGYLSGAVIEDTDLKSEIVQISHVTTTAGETGFTFVSSFDGSRMALTDGYGTAVAFNLISKTSSGGSFLYQIGYPAQPVGKLLILNVTAAFEAVNINGPIEVLIRDTAVSDAGEGITAGVDSQYEQRTPVSVTVLRCKGTNIMRPMIAEDAAVTYGVYEDILTTNCGFGAVSTNPVGSWQNVSFSEASDVSLNATTRKRVRNLLGTAGGTRQAGRVLVLGGVGGKCYYEHVSSEGSYVETVYAEPSTAIVGRSNLKQSAGFHAYLSASQANKTGDGSVYDVAFDVETFDRGGDFSSGAFVARETAPHMLGGTVRLSSLDSSHTQWEAQLLVTGPGGTTAYVPIAFDPRNVIVAGGILFFSIAQMVWLTVGDSVKLRIVVYNGTKTVQIDGGNGTNRTSFWGFAIQ